MKTVTKEYKVFEYVELSDKAKQKALEQVCEWNIDLDWWDQVYEDAEQVGIKITSFDIDRGNNIEGSIITSVPEVIETILGNHGEQCETYKTAKRYQQALKTLGERPSESDENADDGKWEDERENTDHEFLNDILEDYLVMLRRDYEYQTSKEALEETIEANELEFTEDGKIFR